jgi:hypothetical protein
MRTQGRRARVAVGALLALCALAAACGPSASGTFAGPLPLPFNVSDYFSPTGYEGDGANVQDVNLVTMYNSGCPTRSPDPTGDCYVVTYNQQAPEATQGFAGVLWQYPGNNFGEYPGHTVEPGATRVTVWARGNSGGESVELSVGGIDSATEPYHDSISVLSSPFTLTTEWQQLTIGLPASYGEVLAGFGWIVKAQTPGATPAAPVVFYLDGIQWQQ